MLARCYYISSTKNAENLARAESVLAELFQQDSNEIEEVNAETDFAWYLNLKESSD